MLGHVLEDVDNSAHLGLRLLFVGISSVARSPKPLHRSPEACGFVLRKFRMPVDARSSSRKRTGHLWKSIGMVMGRT